MIVASHRLGTTPPSADSWKDEFWGVLVRSLDRALRSCYAITEFTDDPKCVLRLGHSTARHQVVLSDGVTVHIGDPVGTVHLWNEHLPRFRDRGPDIGWAVEIRHRGRAFAARACAVYRTRWALGGGAGVWCRRPAL